MSGQSAGGPAIALESLNIRDMLLIDELHLQLEGGVCAFTGETGAGKSVLFDALGLALGTRGDGGLVRAGCRRADIRAGFVVRAGHPLWGWLDERGIDQDDVLSLRRVVLPDGRTRAYANDRAVSVGILRELRGWLVPTPVRGFGRGAEEFAAREVIDRYGGVNLEAVRRAWEGWRSAQAEWEEARVGWSLQACEALARDVGELQELRLSPGEATEMAERRDRFRNIDRLEEAIVAARELVAGAGGPMEGAAERVALAMQTLERVAKSAGGGLDGVLAALARAGIEMAEAMRDAEVFLASLEREPEELRLLEERWDQMARLSRRHRVDIEELAGLLTALERRLHAWQADAQRIERLQAEKEAAKERWMEVAEEVHGARLAAARSFDAEIAGELPALRMAGARFATRVQRMEEPSWSPVGLDSVLFEVATLPETAMLALERVASAGERSRLVLAMSVVLARRWREQGVLLFDEVDSGIGGASAAAVADRLATLGESGQVLVITHSPQVAARADAHWRVWREDGDEGAASARIEALSTHARVEEIARMISGARITAEARAAALRLLGTPVKDGFDSHVAGGGAPDDTEAMAL